MPKGKAFMTQLWGIRWFGSSSLHIKILPIIYCISQYLPRVVDMNKVVGIPIIEHNWAISSFTKPLYSDEGAVRTQHVDFDMRRLCFSIRLLAITLQQICEITDFDCLSQIGEERFVFVDKTGCDSNLKSFEDHTHPRLAHIAWSNSQRIHWKTWRIIHHDWW